MQTQKSIQGFHKLKLVFILALMSSIAPLSTDMYLPALSSVEQSFKTNSFLTQLSLASFFAAFALGQLIYGPLSDIFGRKKPVLIGVFLFILSSFLCIIIDNIYFFILLRFFEALGGCAGIVIARAIVNDMFEVKESVKIFALMMIFSSLAPMLSPTFGGFLLKYFSWHSIFTTLFILGLLLFLMILFGLKETATKIEKCQFSYQETIRIYKLVLKDKDFILYIFSAGFALAGMFAYITGSSFVFTQFFSLSEQHFGLLFGLNALGFVLCANINSKLVQIIESEKVLACSLIIMLCSVLILLINAFFYPNFWLFESSLFLSIAMLGFIAPNTTSLAMARFKQHSGTASAVLGTTQFALAGIVSFTVGFINANTPVPLALVMSFCILLANLVYFSKRFSVKTM
ncbi:multidrug effflux MFS transporter [Campylobacter sp. MIT 21-1685]|uniref:multidrug effflux MFS transporter n=1 Tax=unclassified Campylobacter TaxID=2593542 RepID=UPI00224AB975|nr:MULTISPECIES: multidrug effflux MFS transporter [unclassified Campylobacter]MCX2683366.1 multidrug effflux MFS transporter [Campylobacter sp. MIT 21-1684]MCX2751579.1 multidrug effflux MFS transporter [Campylobacter sp. MIT 21-1682]MCX2807778.1 multidrug effflux MFS transporter [Campylobacter sp. MIT 21-1685]